MKVKCNLMHQINARNNALFNSTKQNIFHAYRYIMTQHANKIASAQQT